MARVLQFSALMSFQGLVGSTGWASLVLRRKCDQCPTCCSHPKPNFAKTCPNHPNIQRKNLGKINCRGSLCLCFDCLLMGSILDTMCLGLPFRDCGHLSARPRQPALLSNWGRPHDEVWKLWKFEISGSIIGSTLKYLVMLPAPWSMISSL